MIGRGSFCAVALLALAWVPGWTDEVHLKNGKVLEADRVEEVGDKLVLTTEYMTVEVLRIDVARVVRKDAVKPPEEVLTPAGASGSDRGSPAGTVERRRCTPLEIPRFGDLVRTAEDEDRERRLADGTDPRLAEIAGWEASADPKGIARLVELSQDVQPVIHDAALRALGVFDDPDALRILLGQVDHETASVRLAAREGVKRWCARNREVGGVQALQEALQRLDPAQSARLILRAGYFDPEWSRPSVLHGIEWGGSATRLAALMTLRRNQDSSLPGRLPVLLADADWSVRREAAEAAAECGDERCLRFLIDQLGDPEAQVRDTAHRTLRSLTRLDLPADERAWRAWHREREGR